MIVNNLQTDYIGNRTKYRKLSEVSEIDYLNEEIVQIEDKILRLITNVVEKEYHLNLSMFNDLRKKISRKTTERITKSKIIFPDPRF